MTVYSYCTSPHVWTGLDRLSYSGQNALQDMAPNRRADKRNKSISDLSKLKITYWEYLISFVRVW